MNKQHQILLSLGSNLGNRQENIDNCIGMLHTDLGTIVKVSSVYESDSWGFESDKFYNCCVIMHTNKNVQKVLKSCLKIETKLGRIRNESNNYQARIIDIDIISVDDEIFVSDNLHIPHKHLQDRKFVLFPLKELIEDWKHPVLQKSISELIANSC